MKNIFYVLLLTLISGSCRKDPLDKTDFPYEDNHIKIECLSNLNLSSGIYDLNFIDESNGILISNRGKIYTTKDKGFTWTLNYSSSISNEFLHEALFIDKDTAYVAGAYHNSNKPDAHAAAGFILKTTDGGQTWIKIFEVLGDLEFYSIAMNSSGEVFLVQFGYSRSRQPISKILKSGDGGVNWKVAASINYPVLKIIFSDNYGFCYGGYNIDNAKILKSSNNGLNWNETTTFDGFKINDLHFNGPAGFFIMNNTILKTINHGDTWTKINSPANYLGKIQTLASDQLLVFGSSSSSLNNGYPAGIIHQTFDGGKSWIEHKIKDMPTTSKIAFYSSTQGYIIAGNKLLKITLK